MKKSYGRRGFLAISTALFLAFVTRIAPTYAVAGGSDTTDRFLLGTHINIGMQLNGSFGSRGNAPTGFHTRPNQEAGWSTAGDGRLGFTYDNGDGWGTGADVGDFFTPGTPYEGFQLEVNSAGDKMYGQNKHNDMSDLGHGNWTACTGICESWEMVTPFNGLNLVQEYSVIADATLKMHITVSNPTGSAIEGVYYGRCVDPDNTQAAGGGYITTNQVIRTIEADGQAAVQATSTYDTVETALVLFSSDPNARAFYNGDSEMDCSDAASDRWDGTGGWSQAKGTPSEADGAIGLVVRIGTLAAGATYTFDAYYGMNLAAMDSLPSTDRDWSPTSVILAIAAAMTAAAGAMQRVRPGNR